MTGSSADRDAGRPADKPVSEHVQHGPAQHAPDRDQPDRHLDDGTVVRIRIFREDEDSDRRGRKDAPATLSSEVETSIEPPQRSALAP